MHGVACSTEIKCSHKSHKFSAMCRLLVPNTHHSAVITMKQSLFPGPVVAPCIDCAHDSI